MGIQNIPKTYLEMRDWADEYEERAMLPNDNNHELAEITLGLLVLYMPLFAKDFARNVLIGLMDDRLRKAMLYPPPPKYIKRFIAVFFIVRRFLMRNFFLPRWRPLQYTTQEMNQYGRHNTNYVDNDVYILFICN